MRSFAAAWTDEAIVQAPLAQLTWYHHLALLEKVEGPEHRLWYARQAIEHGWSRNVLVAQIETGLHKRAGKALTNFKATLPPPHADLAQQALKDPYIFDFLTLGPDAQERDLERGLSNTCGTSSSSSASVSRSSGARCTSRSAARTSTSTSCSST